jgi:hypothetical protein
MSEEEAILEAAVYALKDETARTVYDAAAWRYLSQTDPDLLADIMDAVDDRRASSENGGTE